LTIYPATPDLSSFPVTITNCERELTFAAPPERVVGLRQPSNELLRLSGFAYDPANGYASAEDKTSRLSASKATTGLRTAKQGASQLTSPTRNCAIWAAF
jgi:hypothetical protein